MQQAQAALEQATLNLAYTTVKAPIAGRVSKKSVEPGQVIQPGQPLLAIVPLEDVWVTANFKETQLKDMRPGQRGVDLGRRLRPPLSRARSRASRRRPARGSACCRPRTPPGNYVKVVQRIPVKIVLDQGQDPEHLLRPGMSVVPTVLHEVSGVPARAGPTATAPGSSPSR